MLFLNCYINVKLVDLYYNDTTILGLPNVLTYVKNMFYSHG